MDPHPAQRLDDRINRGGRTVNAMRLSRRLAALERRLPPPGPPSFRDEYPDLPPGSEAIVAAAVLDAASALDVATGGAPLSVIGPAILLHEARMIESLRTGRPVRDRLSEYGEISDPAAVAELLHAAGCDPGLVTR
jgi:hypothetical protein